MPACEVVVGNTMYSWRRGSSFCLARKRCFCSEKGVFFFQNNRKQCILVRWLFYHTVSWTIFWRSIAAHWNYIHSNLRWHSTACSWGTLPIICPTWARDEGVISYKDLVDATDMGKVGHNQICLCEKQYVNDRFKFSRKRLALLTLAANSYATYIALYLTDTTTSPNAIRIY